MVTEGKKISKEEWSDTNIYGELKENTGYNSSVLTIHRKDGDRPWVPNKGDLEGKDWFVV